MMKRLWLFIVILTSYSFSVSNAFAKPPLLNPGSNIDVSPNSPLSLAFPAVIPCSEFLRSHFEWARTGQHSIVIATLVFNSAGGPVTYAIGDLRPMGDNLVGVLEELSSNRTVGIPGPDTPNPFGNDLIQPFSVRDLASESIELRPDGRMSYKVARLGITWLVCYSNDTAVVFTLTTNKAMGVITLKNGTVR